MSEWMRGFEKEKRLKMEEGRLGLDLKHAERGGDREMPRIFYCFYIFEMFMDVKCCLLKITVIALWLVVGWLVYIFFS